MLTKSMATFICKISKPTTFAESHETIQNTRNFNLQKKSIHNLPRPISHPRTNFIKSNDCCKAKLLGQFRTAGFITSKKLTPIFHNILIPFIPPTAAKFK